MNKFVFWLLFIVFLALVPATILPNTNFAYTLANPAVLANFGQRFLGLTLYVLLFWQLMLGANMDWLTGKLGGWVFNFHIIEGVTIYILAILHPVFFLLYRYFTQNGFDPFYVFIQVCVLCKYTIDYYYTLGRIAFWLINITVFAGLFRATTPFMRANWRKFHVLNYVVFLLIGIHGLSIGTDFMRFPFVIFSVGAYVVVLYIVIFRKIPELIQNIRLWLA